MSALSIGDFVRLRNGKVGKLLGIVAGVAHIGLPEKNLTSAKVIDLVKVPGPTETSSAQPAAEVQPLALSTPVEPKEELVLTPVQVEETPKEDSMRSNRRITAKLLAGASIEFLREYLVVNPGLSPKQIDKINKVIAEKSSTVAPATATPEPVVSA